MLSSENLSNKFSIAYTYTSDSFKNLNVVKYYINNNHIDVNYTNETITTTNNETLYTGRIKEVAYTKNNNEIIKYVYEYNDYTNNITKIEGYTNNVLVYSEENYYDKFNQLNTQEIYVNDCNYIYECGYDTRGNIAGYLLTNQTTNETVNSGEFTYNINNELVSATINGITYNMTYASIGLPSSYLGWNMTYYMNKIASITKGNSTGYYSYNANGIRTYKEVLQPGNCKTVNYILEGNKIIGEVINGNNTNELYYYYDTNDSIVGFTYNGTKYLYIKNLQNDVIGIVDVSGNIVVKYYYDGYGTIIDTIDTSGINLSSINLFRYRSYYQDDETGWYYLNSRYYDPLTKRFITMDDISYLGASGTVLSYNLFSYCENNPVNNVDPNGNVLAALSWGTVASTVWSAKGAFATIGAISRAALIAFATIVAAMLVTYAIGNIMLKEVEKAIAEERKHVNGKHTVYVLIANGGTIGSGVFYVGRTKNFGARYSAHKANIEKILADGAFLMVPVYTGLDAVSAKALEQGLMNAFGAHILINKIRGIAKTKIKSVHWTSAVLSYVSDVAENEWLYWLEK